ncbi:uncharacterized protein [Diadema antillarum]|uniref:uncharacterized protein n=1 Tax=Diadema antillarum TaxID=105358 RepID=UPI003A8952FE
MFAVIGAICERVTAMDALGQELLDHSDLLDIQRKMDLYSSMFYCSGTNGDRNDNFINKESLRIELKAGGLNRTQEDYVIEKMNADEHNKISFLDYMAYIPLFLSMHDNIINNPLDFAEKYNKPSTEIQRDMNPIGLPLKRTYHAVHQNLMGARRNNSSTSRNNAKLTAKELSSTKLPNIMNRMTGLKIHQTTPGSATKRPKP